MSMQNFWEHSQTRTVSSIIYIKEYKEYFFNDGKRLIDYILVYNKHTTSPFRTKFLGGLLELGIQLEETRSMVDPKLRFIKVHAPRTLLMKYAQKFDIPVKKLQKNYIRPPIPSLKFMRTELTAQDPFSPNYDRAEDTFSMSQPMRTLRNERMLIMYNILKRVIFGPSPTTHIGIHHLLENVDDMVAAYPPHDGSSKWSDNMDDPLNDRQLLRRYWSSPRNFFKTQPLDVIERYFGDNIALYFAWLSFYNRMLILPIIIGLIVTIINFATPRVFMDMKKVCQSEKLLCPRCLDCPAMKMNESSCGRAKLTYHLDTIGTVSFSCFMSFWAAFYVVLWRRKQVIFDVRWNIKDTTYEEQDNRPEFENYAKHVRVSELGEPELYIPWYIIFYRKCISHTIFALVAVAVATIHFLIVEAGAILGARTNYSTYGTICISLGTVLVIVIMRRVGISCYEPLVHWLVNLELPQTQTEFDNSYIIKIFAFSFINNYFALLYTSFFKGKFYSHPNDKRMYTSNLQVVRETCDYTGCTSDIFIEFMLLMTLIPLLTHFVNWIFAFVHVWARRLKEKRANIKHMVIPRWEKDYQLLKRQPQQLLILYEENVVEFGFVTLFAFAFPAAPLFAFINNIIKIHIDAHNLVVKHRRPQAKRTASVGAWLSVTSFLTYLSIVTNALYMMYTSNFPTYIYAYYGNYKYLFDFTSSTYYINLYRWPNAGVGNGTACFYPGMRYPPDHEKAYTLTDDYYTLNFYRAIFILLFEHIVWIITIWISHSIPSIPNFIREKFAIETMELRKYLTQPASEDSSTNIRGIQPLI